MSNHKSPECAWSINMNQDYVGYGNKENISQRNRDDDNHDIFYDGHDSTKGLKEIRNEEHKTLMSHGLGLTPKQAAPSILDLAIASYFNIGGGGGSGLLSSNSTSETIPTDYSCTQLTCSYEAPTAPLIRASMHLLQANGSISGREVAASILPRFPDLLRAIPLTSNRNALSCIDGRTAISHKEIHDFILDFGRILHQDVHIGRGDRIAVVLPNGPELALAILAVASWASCVPLNAFAAVAELQSDLEKSGVCCIIGMDPKQTGSGVEIAKLANQLNIPFCGLVPDSDRAAIFELNLPSQVRMFDAAQSSRSVVMHPIDSDSVSPIASVSKTGIDWDLNRGICSMFPKDPDEEAPSNTICDQFDDPCSKIISDAMIDCNKTTSKSKQVTFDLRTDDLNSREMPSQHNDEVLVLFTSGTTGSKKLVPHILSDILVATACISVSWKLSPSDTNCNLMPLFHVGGIIRQVFSPVLSGGCVICCPSFDPLMFWKLMINDKDLNHPKQPSFTWYYAAPTMHQLILQTGWEEGYISDRDDSCFQPSRKLRMIANAAGGLLPSLARDLRRTFGAHVLPSYGMTECMPITSPPASYELERPGTSGVAVGPELEILNLRTLQPMKRGEEGPICVRHTPCFRGYGIITGDHSTQGEERPFTFLKNPYTGRCSGWFDTGDLGYMDSDGYLYITGRSKEVINRGGEIISPMEVEEAIISHPDVAECAAFSTAHAVLQEIVGLLLVPKPGRPRLDLPTLHNYLGQGRLAAPKWPQCLVYMDNGLPKSFTNKLLRVKLGTRLNIPELNDSMLPIERTFQAKCPPQGTAVSVAIPCELVSVSAAYVQTTLQKLLLKDSTQQELLVVHHPTKIGALVAYVLNIDRVHFIKVARANIDAYLVPTHVCFVERALLRHTNCKIMDSLPHPQPSDSIGSILQEFFVKEVGPLNHLVIELQELMMDLLDLDCLPEPSASFFNIGGSSMLASQLASRIRKLYSVPFGGSDVFHHSSCNAIFEFIQKHDVHENKDRCDNQISGIKQDCRPMLSKNAEKSDCNKSLFDHTRLEIYPGWITIILQLIPLYALYPVFSFTRFYLFFGLLMLVLNNTPSDYTIVKFIISLICFHICWIIFLPMMFVACKWVIIGKYRSGRYPIWGSYYLRWWFVELLRKLIGKGAWGSYDCTLNLFYRLLGAQIGKNVRISAAADLAEYDLVTIKDGAIIEMSTVRAFGIDNGAMILGPVCVGKNASVGLRSVVAPFTSVPQGTHLSPLEASYNMEFFDPQQSSTENIRFNRQALPSPNNISEMIVIRPIMLIVNAISYIPALSVLNLMLNQPWNYEEPFQSTGHMMQWLCDGRRIPFFIGIRVARAILGPFFYMAAAILVKWLIIGKFRPGRRDTKSEWQLIRHQLVTRLFTRESMQECADLLGRHYYLVSALYRLLGAKVGKRVFWPGRQPLFTGEFDLLEIGDDVVFGSRSSLLCTTMDSAEKIILCAGSNISDNTVVLPGSVIGKGAVLGSNTICPAGRYLPQGSIWLGCRNGQPTALDKGVENFEGLVYARDIKPANLRLDGDETTIRPFGKAFYHRDATYFVYPLPLILAFTLATRIFVSTLNALPIIGALHMASFFIYGWKSAERDYLFMDIDNGTLYPVILLCFIVTHFIHTIVWLTVEILSKWTFIGQRREGRFNYDTSSYAQNWELYQISTKVRDLGRLNFLDYISGTPFIALFFRLLGCQVGDHCCLYPTGGDPYMSEPDLVQIGNRCVIDCASVVCHLNTRGNFELVKIVIESNATLRTRSRIQQGVHMETGSMLLEKSLALTGEIIESDSVWYGGPAARLFDYTTISSVSSSNPQLLSTAATLSSSFDSDDCGVYA